MTDIETRIFAGSHAPEDAQWLAFLDEIFRDVTLAGFAEHGMDASDARRLVNLLAMARRASQEQAN